MSDVEAGLNRALQRLATALEQVEEEKKVWKEVAIVAGLGHIGWLGLVLWLVFEATR